jgi:hypothetical protein
MCHAVGQGMTGVRLFIQAGKFFERAPDEMPYACYWGSKMATNNQDECTRLRLFWRLFFPCCGPVTAPVIHLFFFRKMPILWAFTPEQRSNFLFFTGARRKAIEMQTAVAFSQIGESKKGIDLLPLGAKTNPGIHPLWRL